MKKRSHSTPNMWKYKIICLLCHNQASTVYAILYSQARSQDLEKGGAFWKSEKSADDLDPNFDCSWISFTRFVPNSDEISRKARKFEGFFRPKSGGLQKQKKKVFAEIESDFSAGFFRPISGGLQKKKKVFAEIESNFFGRSPKFFSAQKQVISKKKKVFAEIESDFSAKFGNSNVSGGVVFLWRGLFSIFHKKSASKALKTCNFEYFSSQWGARAPPASPPGYATVYSYPILCLRFHTMLTMTC